MKLSKRMRLMFACILRHTAAVGAVVQRPLCGLRSGRN